MLIYISCLETEEARSKLTTASQHLIEDGFTPVAPFEGTEQILWENHAMNRIKRCDAIFLFSNWIFSKRARIEKCIAEEYGKQVIFENITMSNPKIDQLKKVIENVFGLHFEELTTPCKKRNKYFARMIFVHHCLKLVSNIETANLINRDPCTLQHYKREFENEIKFNKQFRELAAKTETIINMVMQDNQKEKLLTKEEK